MSDAQWLERAEDLDNARIANEAGLCLYCSEPYTEHTTSERASCFADLRALER